MSLPTCRYCGDCAVPTWTADGWIYCCRLAQEKADLMRAILGRNTAIREKEPR